MKFSQRLGYKPVREIIQRETVDLKLRNALWNALMMFYWNELPPSTQQHGADSLLLTRFWINYYEERIDEIPSRTKLLVDKIKNNFINGEWTDVYDILQFVTDNYESELEYPSERNEEFIEFINYELERNLSAYRYVSTEIVEVASKVEIDSIEDAINNSSIYVAVQSHLKTALAFLANREVPDYRNSIKESISAVEALSCHITNNPKATLGQALKEIEKEHEIHSALKNSLSSLYGWTSDAEGIRHKMMEQSTLKQEDAKFMLVTCTAFINYLLAKTAH